MSRSLANARNRRLDSRKLALAVVLFLLIGFAGVWWFTSHAAQNPASDLNHDNTINVLDLSMLLSSWGLTGSRPADINSDSSVGILDLSILLANWGPVTATPTPTPTGPCALPNYPNASCTGVPAGTSLTVINSGLTLRTPGEVIDGKDIRGCVDIEAPNVTIRRSKITCDFAYGIRHLDGDYPNFGGLLIEDTEISCDNSTATGVAGASITARRLHVHSCENGFSTDANFTIEDSYVHGLINDGTSHTDGIQIPDDAHDITIRHNTVLNDDPNGTSAIIGDTGTQTNELITDNLLGGAGWTLYCPRDGGSNYRLLNNHFSRMFYPTGGFYGPLVCDNVSPANRTGNVWDDTGLPVD